MEMMGRWLYWVYWEEEEVGS